MKNRMFRFIFSVVLTFFTMPLLAQDCLVLFFHDGSFRKFYLKDIVEITSSKFDAEGVQHSDYQYQHITTHSNKYVYELENIDSITFSKYNEELAQQNFVKAMPKVFSAISECEKIADVDDKIEQIKNAEGVANAWSDGHKLYVSLSEGETFSFHFNHDIDVDLNSINNAASEVRSLIPRLEAIKQNNQKLKVVIANQQDKDEKNAGRITMFENLISDLEKCGITAVYEDNPTVDFFYDNSDNPKKLNLYDYDIIILSTHGSYDNNPQYINGQLSFTKKLHSIVTSDGFILYYLNERPDWQQNYIGYKAWRDNSRYSDATDAQINYGFYEEIRNNKKVWVAYPELTELFFSDIAKGRFNNKNSILFNCACESLKGGNSLAEAFSKHDLGVYIGFTETNRFGQKASCYLFETMLQGASLYTAKEILPDYCKVENLDNVKKYPTHFSASALETLQDEGLFNARLKNYPENKELKLFLLPPYSEQISQNAANDEFNKSQTVTVKGNATLIDFDPENVKAGFTLSCFENGQNIIGATQFVTAEIEPINYSNIINFQAKFKNLERGKTYQYRVYTYDGKYYNYGKLYSFTINGGTPTDPKLKKGDLFTWKTIEGHDVVIKVTSNENNKYTCEVENGNSSVGSRIKHAGNNFPPAIDPDIEGSMTIPETAAGFNVTAIGINAFKDCGKVTAINLPESIEEIGESAMSGCVGLTSIIIPKNVKAIKANAFGGCKNVKSIYAEMTTPFSIAENVFQTAAEEQAGISSTLFANATLYVPVGSKEQYANTSGWNKFQRVEEYTPGDMPGPGPDNPDPENPDSNIINFADANVKTICVSNWDTNGDGELSKTEAAAVTDLGNVFMYDSEIASFNELQFFTGLSSVGDGAFKCCNRLTSITIPNSVMTIEEYAFYECSGLTAVTIPNSVTTIGEAAFYGCTDLVTLTISNSVNRIEKYTFYGCSSLTSVTIPNSIESIDVWAFLGCSSLTSITFHCNEIKYWFSETDNIKEIVIGDEVTRIAEHAFSSYTGLTSITIPNSVTSIGQSAFYGCTGLTSINIGNSLTAIERETFYGCSSLTSITIPNSVTTIGYCAFEGCSSLASVVIGNSVTKIDHSAFSNCSSLTTMTFHCNEIKRWCNSNWTVKEVIIGDEVTSIGESAFELFTALTSVTIGKAVTSIGVDAFNGCNLTSVTFHCTDIQRWFNFNNNIEEVTIGEEVKGIGEKAFYGFTKLTSVTIPNSVTSIGELAFGECDKLTSITSNIFEPFAIDNSTFSVYNSATLYVPAGCKAKYEATEGWKKFKNIVEMGGDDPGNAIISFVDPKVKAICVDNWDTDKDGELSRTELAAVKELGLLFNNNTEITSFNELQYFTGLTSIGNHAFYGCRGLTSVTIPNSVTSIGSIAFEFCSGLTSISFGNSLTSIGMGAFTQCNSLTSIRIPNSVTNIEVGAFIGCHSLTSIIVEEGNTHYDSRDNCNAIIETASNTLIAGCQTTIIPNSVKNIGGDAFCDCSNLTSITIPNSVTNIGFCAFNNCNGLTSIIIGNSVTKIDISAFGNCNSLKMIQSLIENPFPINTSVFEGIYTTATLYVPAGCKAKYEATEGWKNFQNIVEMGETPSETLCPDSNHPHMIDLGLPNDALTPGMRLFPYVRIKAIDYSQKMKSVNWY